MTFDRLTIGLLFIAVALLAAIAPAQSDTWWHLRVGHDIWTSRTLSLTDTYSYTAAGRPFPNHEWLTEVLFYLLYRLGGLPTLTAVCAAAIVVAWWLSWRLAQGAFEVRLVSFALAVACSTVSWAIRPQVLSMVALMGVVTAVVTRRRRWLPLIFLLWANLHGAVALGLVALAGATLGTVIAERRFPRGLVLTAVLSGGVTCLTPLGWTYWPAIVTSIARSRQSGLVEWVRPTGAPAMWPFWLAVGALVAATIGLRRRLDPRGTVLVAIAWSLLPLALAAIRNVPMFMLVAVPALAAFSRPTRVEPAVPRWRAALHLGLLGAALASALVVVSLVWWWQLPLLGWRPLAPGLIAQVRACPGPLYNTYEAGGPLLWFVPDRLVFIDSRQDPYPDDVLAADKRLESTGDYRLLFATYHIECALVPAGSLTGRRLQADGSWLAAYSDAAWSLWIHR